MTRSEIIPFFQPGLLPHFGGMNYSVPTLGWLQGAFWDFFKARYWSEDLDKWKFRWQCRDFARAYACAAQECWASTVADSDADACAVGEIWYSPDPKSASGHAICPVFTERGLQFIEPQTGHICELSPEQFSSRYYLRY